MPFLQAIHQRQGEVRHNTERGKRLDELKRKLEVTQPIKSIESHLEQTEVTGVAEKEVGLQATLN
jgi:hypothetical protein